MSAPEDTIGDGPIEERFRLLMNALAAGHIAAMRAYLRQWIAGDWRGAEVATLRRQIDGLTSRETIRDWLKRALDIGIDPL